MIHFRSEVIKTAGSSTSIKNKKKGGRNKKNKNKMMDLSDLTGPYPIVSPGESMGKISWKGVPKNSKERVVVLRVSPRGHDLNHTASMSHLGARMHTNVKSALSALFLLQSKSRLGQSAAGRDGRRRTPRTTGAAKDVCPWHTHSLDHSRQTPLQFTLQNRRTAEQSNFVSDFAKRSLLCYTSLHTIHRLIRFRWSH